MHTNVMVFRVKGLKKAKSTHTVPLVLTVWKKMSIWW